MWLLGGRGAGFGDLRSFFFFFFPGTDSEMFSGHAINPSMCVHISCAASAVSKLKPVVNKMCVSEWIVQRNSNITLG